MKTSKALSGAALALALALPWSLAHAEEGATDLNLFAGQKYLEENDWEPIDEQTSFGLSIHHQPEGWWLGGTLGIYNGTSDEFVTLANGNPGELTGDTWEMAFGPGRVFKIPGIPVRVYAAGGYAYMTASLKIREDTGSGIVTSRFRDAGSGYWASTGIFVTVAEQINLGIEARHSRGEVSLGGTDFEAGGDYVGAILGFHFQ